tara:strand:- start:904 stop:1044 length:141 start_codon:yes stop_codon:yes gene_type:complete
MCWSPTLIEDLNESPSNVAGSIIEAAYVTVPMESFFQKRIECIESC